MRKNMSIKTVEKLKKSYCFCLKKRLKNSKSCMTAPPSASFSHKK